MAKLMQTRLSVLLVGLVQACALVQVEQFGMAQCPMTSTLTTNFYDRCFTNGHGIADAVNYTLNMVGGTSGGLIDNTTDNKSFHGDQEIVAEKYVSFLFTFDSPLLRLLKIFFVFSACKGISCAPANWNQTKASGPTNGSTSHLALTVTQALLFAPTISQRKLTAKRKPALKHMASILTHCQPA